MSTTVDLGKITASVTVGTTTTGAAGTNASVSNSGTNQDAVLNFTIPRGAQGVQGPQGIQGNTGPAGPTGPQGPMGDVAVITPEQQAAFTMYSVPGQNTDGPMTQKAVTDNLVASAISYDNSQSWLAATNVQDGIDELSQNVAYYAALDQNGATYPTNVINTANPPKWVSASGASSILIPVSTIQGEKLHIVGNGNATGTIYAFLTSNSTTTNTSPSFATGYTSRITRGGSETFDVSVPTDATYLWFMFKSSQGNMMPAVYTFDNVQDLKDELDEHISNVTISDMIKTETWDFSIGGHNGSSASRTSDRNLYYIERGTTLTIPSNMELVIQSYAEDGGIGSETSATSWVSGTYTFGESGWYRFIGRNSSNNTITSAQNALLNAMTCVKYMKDYPRTKFYLYSMYRTTGQMRVYDHSRYISPLSTTQTLNDKFFELDGSLLSMYSNSQYFLIFFDSQYKRVTDSITFGRDWEYYTTNLDCSGLGAKYVRIVAQDGDDYKNVYAVFTSGVKNNTYTSADVTVSVNSDTEIIADSSDATGAIQQALFLAYIRGGKAILYKDDYILNSTTPWVDDASAPTCCIWIPCHYDTESQYSNESQFFTLEGTIQPASYNDGVRMILGESVYNSVTDASPLSVLRSEKTTSISNGGGTASIALKNLNILLPNNQKAITTIDLQYTECCDIQNVNTMAGYSTLNWGHTNAPPIANANCIGIRGLIGSNWSVLNTFTNVEAFGYYIGIDWCGEHLSGRNISVKYNYYGMTFDHPDTGFHQGHPIVLINVLDEHSVCLPKFGALGASYGRMVIIHGYNIMFPSQVTQGTISATDARHHKAVDDNTNKYAWNGEITYTCNNDQGDGSIAESNIQDFAFFEKGGFNIKCINTRNYRIASDTSLADIEPNFLQEVWSRTHNKLLVFDGDNWKDTAGNVVYTYPTYTLSGVVDDGSNPISGASVKYTYRSVDYTTTTDSSGAYSLTVPKWTGVIEVTASGFTTFSRRIKITANTTLNVTLT